MFGYYIRMYLFLPFTQATSCIALNTDLEENKVHLATSHSFIVQVLVELEFCRQLFERVYLLVDLRSIEISVLGLVSWWRK